MFRLTVQRPLLVALAGCFTLPLWLAFAGVVTAYIFYMVAPQIPATLARVCPCRRRSVARPTRAARPFLRVGRSSPWATKGPDE